MGFLKNFIFIDNEDINSIYDQQIFELTEGKIDMGIIETLKMQERREGKAEGAKEKSHAIVENLIVKLGFSNEQAADVAEVTVNFVKNVRREIANTKP